MPRETARDHLCSRYAAVIAARARTTSRLTPRPSYKSYLAAGQRWFPGIAKDHTCIEPSMYQPWPGEDDRPMGEATTELEYRHVTTLGWSVNLAGVTHQSLEIAFRIAMQVPVGGIERHVNMRNYSHSLVHFGEKHQTISPAVLDSAHMVVRGSQPCCGLGDHPLALAHIAVSGVGI